MRDSIESRVLETALRVGVLGVSQRRTRCLAAGWPAEQAFSLLHFHHKVDARPGLKPTFLFIGPDKSGSTWLYEILRRHPECYVPPIKDLYFFDRHYDRGLQWYYSFFAQAPPTALAIGELSHDYLFSERAADRIARDLPRIRLITSLRDPAERTFSHYLHLVRSGRTRAPFWRAVEEHPELIENSLYHGHLSRYLDRFPKERVLILFFQDLERNPREFAFRLFDFLGLSRMTGPEIEHRYMSASRPRSYLLARLAGRGADAARRMRLTRLVGWLKRSTVTRLLYRPYRSSERPRLSVRDRVELIEKFRPDVERLETLVDRDLSAWLTTRDVPVSRP